MTDWNKQNKDVKEFEAPRTQLEHNAVEAEKQNGTEQKKASRRTDHHAEDGLRHMARNPKTSWRVIERQQ